MLDLIVSITVRDDAEVPAVVDALERMRPMCLAEPGCVSWEALQSESDPRRITLVERWETRELWEAHDDLDAIQRVYLPQILPRVDREVHVSRRLG